jgi:hypothetical protein
MRVGALELALALGVVALGCGCTKVNPRFCGDHVKHDCEMPKADAAVDSHPDATETGDVGETGGDVVVEAGPESKPPVCVTDNECSADAGTPACSSADGGAMCVQCTDSKKHCADPQKPVCDQTAQKCVECVGTGTECTADAAKSVCNVATQSCVECINNTKCTGTKPICDMTQKACRACTADSECKDIGPGICVDFDGHCATNAEVVFLDRGGACDSTQSQYCVSGLAVTALTGAKPILLISGAMPVAAIDISGAAPNPVLIVGRGGASVGAGSGDIAGVRIDGVRKAWVRDLKISGGTVGVLADAGADLRLTRCTIVGNGAGGIRTIGASFVITNTIVAANSQGEGSGGVSWAGVRLGDPPVGGSGRFENNTVVDNTQVGIACSTVYDITTDIVHGNTGGESVNCSAANCCGAGDPDPKLDASYHLMSGSPCIDKIDATATSLTIDIQGQPRPAPPGKLDCGADELVP